MWRSWCKARNGTWVRLPRWECVTSNPSNACTKVAPCSGSRPKEGRQGGVWADLAANRWQHSFQPKAMYGSQAGSVLKPVYPRMLSFNACGPLRSPSVHETARASQCLAPLYSEGTRRPRAGCDNSHGSRTAQSSSQPEGAGLLHVPTRALSIQPAGTPFGTRSCWSCRLHELRGIFCRRTST